MSRQRRVLDSHISPAPDLASRACTGCAKRKSKCDYVLPRCGRCAQSGLDCFFPKRRRPGPQNLVRGPANPQIPGALPKQFQTSSNESSTASIDLRVEDSQDPANSRALKRPRHSESKEDPSPGYSKDRTGISIDSDGINNPLLRHKLVEIYLANGHRLFPCFPVFQKSKLLDSFHHVNQNVALLDSICAMATRFCDGTNLFHNVDKKIAAGDRFAARAKTAYHSRIHGDEMKLDLDDIKTSLLLSLYNFARHSDYAAWTMAGETIRLAYELELDKEDPFLVVSPEVSDELFRGRKALAVELEKEDRRHLWWSIWKLDIYYSGQYGRPFAVDPCSIQTFLPSTTTEHLMAGEPAAVEPKYLNNDISQASKTVRDLNLSSMSDVQRFYFITNRLLRSASDLRRLNLSHLDNNYEMFLFEVAISSVELLLPDPLHESFVINTPGMQITKGRILAESALLVHLSVIILYLPNANDDDIYLTLKTSPTRTTCSETYHNPKNFHGNWQKCIRAALAMVDVLKGLSMEIIPFFSPTSSSSVFLISILISFQRAVTQDELERKMLASCVDFLSAVLQRLGRVWLSANSLHGFLEKLMASLPDAMDVSEVFRILRRWNGPLGKEKLDVPPRFRNVEELKESSSDSETLQHNVPDTFLDTCWQDLDLDGLFSKDLLTDDVCLMENSCLLGAG